MVNNTVSINKYFIFYIIERYWCSRIKKSGLQTIFYDYTIHQYYIQFIILL